MGGRGFGSKSSPLVDHNWGEWNGMGLGLGLGMGKGMGKFGAMNVRKM